MDEVDNRRQAPACVDVMSGNSDRAAKLLAGSSGDGKVFLFLQGHPSAFARELADELERNGARALRINFCVGDWLMWRRPGGVSYRGTRAGWPGFLERFIRQHGVTHLLYYADRLPYHRDAIDVARRLGVHPITYEFGYLRPDWITLEHGGMSAHSHFPCDPEAIRAIAAKVPEPDLVVRYHHSFADEAVNEVFYNLLTFFTRAQYPFYNPERYYNTLVDYLSYVPRLLAQRRRGRRARERTANWLKRGLSYFLVPLQMQSDYQLRANSPYPDQRKLIDEIVSSFARHADPGDYLVFKIHPLDNGLERWSVAVGDAGRRHGVSGRLHPIDGGDLGVLVNHAKGVVMNNSTVGIHALRAGRPVKSLGMALFDVPGLTHQGSLDDFWRNPLPPDMDLMGDFVRAIAGTIQVKGSFFSTDGRAAAIPEMARRLLSDEVNSHGAYAETPPRLAAAHASGVPFTAWSPPMCRFDGPEGQAARIGTTDPTVDAPPAVGDGVARPI